MNQNKSLLEEFEDSWEAHEAKRAEERKAHAKEYAHNYYLAHKEQRMERSRKWYAAHKDDPAVKEANKRRCKDWYQRNRERILADSKKKHREKVIQKLKEEGFI